MAVHNVELRPGAGGQLARAAGASCTLVKKGELTTAVDRVEKSCFLEHPAPDQLAGSCMACTSQHGLVVDSQLPSMCLHMQLRGLLRRHLLSVMAAPCVTGRLLIVPPVHAILVPCRRRRLQRAQAAIGRAAAGALPLHGHHWRALQPPGKPLNWRVLLLCTQWMSGLEPLQPAFRRRRLRASSPCHTRPCRTRTSSWARRGRRGGAGGGHVCAALP